MNEFYTRALIETRAGNMGEPMRFIASTEDVARDGMIIEAAAWQLENYRRNPVVLWAHDYFGQHAPIGRADAFVDDNRLLADITFDQNDPFAVSIERKYRDGFLSAVSVGWRTLEAAPSQNPKVWQVVKRADLMDISAVPVPSDPKALKERQARGYKDLQSQLTDILNTPDSDSDESAWKRTASEMLDLFLSGDSLDENERKARYNQLVKEYRKLDKVAPEQYTPAQYPMTLKDLDNVRGMFLEGEAEMFPEKFIAGQRKGAVLNARNRADLNQAIELINGVLERATKEEDTEPRDAEAESLRVILETLNKGK